MRAASPRGRRRAVDGAAIVIARPARPRGDGHGRRRSWRCWSSTRPVGVLSVGLPDPARLESLTFAQPTVVYDRTGTVELGQFQLEDRRVVTFGDVPQLVLDATTTAEDRTFWTNSGFDAAAIAAAAAEGASGTSERGASTITQQLVRARLLPSEVTEPGADKYMRKAKELIQSMRLSDAFPGEAGKDRIITAYLNEIFYGHGAYGIAAAAEIYFGVTDLAEADAGPGRAAGRAAEVAVDPRPVPLRQEGRRRAGWSSRPTARRSSVATGSSTAWPRARAGRSSRRPQLQAALAEPVVLAGDQPRTLRAAQFTWQVRRQLDAILGDPRRTGRDRRLHGHHDARLEGPAARREVAGRRRDRPQPVAQGR